MEFTPGKNSGTQTEAHNTAGTTGAVSDYTFTGEDVLPLSTFLADIAHKWENIAIALGLPEVQRVECGKDSSFAVNLYHVIEKWIIGQCSGSLPATMKHLKHAIAGPFVQNRVMASKLDEFISGPKCLPEVCSSANKRMFNKQMLVKRYLNTPEVPRDSWPPVGAKKFVTLALLKSDQQQVMQSDYSISGNADDVLAKKEPITYMKAFEMYESGSMTLILGRPGCGKTTLVHNITKDWARGTILREAEIVLIVSLRMLNLSNSHCLVDILRPYKDNEEVLAKTKNSFELEDGKGVCFIFDGFDEYHPQDKEKSVVYKLINKSYLSQSMVIVSSRPAAASAHLDISQFKKTIEVFGFSREQIFEYIDSYPFTQSSNTEELALHPKLKDFLMSHPNVLDMCYVPVNCAIVCFLYDKEPTNLPETQTKIYEIFTKLIILRQLTRYDKFAQLHSLEELKGDHTEYFNKLCELAFNMTIISQQVISHGIASADDTPSLGLVTIDISAQLSGFQNSYSFLHLTLQEFLSAYHISRQSQEKQLEIIDKYSGLTSMYNVWIFYCGLVDFNYGPKHARRIFSGIESNLSVKFSLFKVQCAYESQHEEVCEIASSKSFTCLSYSTYDLTALGYVVSLNAEQRKTEHTKHISLHVLNNNQLNALFKQMTNTALWYLEDITVVMHKDLDTSANLEYLSRQMINSTNLKRLELARMKIEYKGIKSLLQYNWLKYLQTLIITEGNIDCEAIALLANGMSSSFLLEELNLSKNGIGDEGVKALAEELPNFRVLQTLILSSNKISDEGFRALAIKLHSSITLLKLDLSCNLIGSGGAATFDFQQCSTKNIGSRVHDIYSCAAPTIIGSLKELHVNHNRIDHQSGIALSNYVLNNFQQLALLDLSGNILGSKGVVDVCLTLLHHNNLQVLNLAYNRPCSMGIILLWKYRPALNLPCNNLTSEDAVALAKGLDQAQKLYCPLLQLRLNPTDKHYYEHYQEIDLSFNKIDDNAAIILINALKFFGNIRKVRLYGNRIEDKSALNVACKHQNIEHYVCFHHDSCKH